ncbi:MAG: hypothetical protein O2840_04810 [bacterium]|nr:hypothetical protein [bacterium]
MGAEARKFFSGSVEDVYSPGDWFPHILSECNDKDLKRFSAHGITKFNEQKQLQALLIILTTGKLKGDWAFIKSSGYVDAYVTGSFTLIAPIDESLTDDKGKLNIGVIVVNPYFTPLIPILAKNFPGMKFIRAEQFPKWMEDQKMVGILQKIRRKLLQW